MSLCFDSQPLADDMAILGAPVAHLEIAADRPSAMVSVRLSEVFPDGTSALITYGLLNLTHRHSHEDIAPLEPGKRYGVDVTLNDAAHVFAAGNRIRLAVANGLWPIAWPSPEPVTLTLTTGASSLSLPVRSGVDADGDNLPLPPAEMSRVHPRTVLRMANPPEARIEHDVATGRVDFIHSEDSGKTRIDAHGWTFGGTTWRRYSVLPDDPTSAVVELNGREEYGREGAAMTRVEIHQTMTGDATHFQVHARLDAFENDRPVFTRSWLERIPRDGV
jgi:hypothetical protein